MTAFSYTASSSVHVLEFMICQQQAAVISMVWYTLEQRIFLYDSYVKHGSARK
jgi:hypothetical protein